MALDRGNPDGRFFLASLIQDSGDAPRAMQAYRDLLAMDPNHPWAQNNLAAMLTDAGDAQAAVPLARHAAELVPQNAAVTRARAQNAAGDREAARDSVARALALSATFKGADDARGLQTQLTK